MAKHNVLSHIHIHQDQNEPTAPRFLSTCKADYAFDKNLSFVSECPARVRNADVMHADQNRFVPVCSITAANFDRKQSAGRRSPTTTSSHLVSGGGDLRTKTNFQLAGDRRSLSDKGANRTTQTYYFRNPNGSNRLSKFMPQPPTNVCNPDDKRPNTASTYRNEYPGQDVHSHPLVKVKARMSLSVQAMLLYVTLTKFSLVSCPFSFRFWEMGQGYYT